MWLNKRSWSNSRFSHFIGSIEDLLKELHLEKYIDNFKENEVDLEAFVSLNREDINAIGVETIPSKELLLQAIHQLQKERKPQ